MSDRDNTFGEPAQPSALQRERVLLRLLADKFYGAYLLRVIEGVTHNLSSPLQVLYIRSEQLEQNLGQLHGLKQCDGATQVAGIVDRMEEKITSILASLDDLNSQLKHLAIPLLIEKHSEMVEVKINEVIEHCLFLLNANMFFKHNVKKTLRLDYGLPMLKGRRTDLCIIILNLMQNALEAMVDAQEKHFVIETSSQEGKVIIKIQDTGSGIPETDRAQIYDVFFTTKKGTEHDGEAEEHAGLGLALVSLLLDDYNGTIACESIPGKTTFTIQIPYLAQSLVA